MIDLGELIENEREAKIMSRVKLADKAMCAPLDIIRIENGDWKWVPLGRMERILNELGIEIQMKSRGMSKEVLIRKKIAEIEGLCLKGNSLAMSVPSTANLDESIQIVEICDKITTNYNKILKETKELRELTGGKSND